jgi:tetratricopeptide (TPR) repeat protein
MDIQTGKDHFMLRSLPAHFKTIFAVALLALTFSFAALPSAVAQDAPPAQTDADKLERQRAFEAFAQGRFTEAAPLLEKLAQKSPKDVAILSRLGWSLFASAAAIKDSTLRVEARRRAQEILLRSKQLGDNSDLTNFALQAIAQNEDYNPRFSARIEADKAMKAGEAAFVQGDFQKALAAYERAMQIDPTLYEAPLFAGDVYFKTDRQKEAGEMFARAIQIAPERETAYRYWGDALLKEGKTAEARDKFIEAYLAQPYNRLAVSGLVKWAQATGAHLAHPKIDVPNSVSPMNDNKMTITIDPKSLKDDDSDGSSAWLMYGLSRAAWATNDYAEFKKNYPNERTYRHSLAEEASALRMVLTALNENMKKKKIKQLDPSLANLQRLEKDGLLESYILLARADAGIARDYAAYRQAHKDLLRRYVIEYVLTGGGKS